MWEHELWDHGADGTQAVGTWSYRDRKLVEYRVVGT